MIGHGVGLDAHEKPWIRIGDETVLEAGMVLTLEPWMHNPERGTFCNEDVFLVT